MQNLSLLFTQELHKITQEAEVTFPFTLGVAVSGGADSLALTLLAHQYTLTHNIPFKTITVNHGLRPEAPLEAQQVHLWLNSRNISHEVLNWTPSSFKCITQEEARQARYHILSQWARENKIPLLLLGHHALDQAETILMRFCKSSHLRGLRGMERLQWKEHMFLGRPLLTVWPETLRDFLHQSQQNWIEDPSNKSPKYLRTQARQLLTDSHSPLQYLGLTPQRLIHWAQKITDRESIIRRQCNCFLREHLFFDDIKQEFHVDKLVFLAQDPALQAHILETFFINILKKPWSPRWISLKKLCETIQKGCSSTLGGYKFQVKMKNIIISSEYL